MQINIFRGPGRVFGFTEDSTGSNLPAKFGPWSAFKTIELEKDGAPVPGVNAEECLNDIDVYGYHVTDAHVRITEECL